MPLGATSCLDLTASRRGRRGRVMVVRTIDTSSWIIP